jgi:hypothetical protein
MGIEGFGGQAEPCTTRLVVFLPSELGLLEGLRFNKHP